MTTATDRLAFAVTAACILATSIVMIQLLRGRYRWHRVLPTIVAIEVALVLSAVFDLARLLGAPRLPEPGVHVAYVAASVTVLPVVAGRIRDDDGRWAASLLAVGLAVCAVVVIRTATTGRVAGV